MTGTSPPTDTRPTYEPTTVSTLIQVGYPPPRAWSMAMTMMGTRHAAVDLKYPGVRKQRGNKDEDDAPKGGDNDDDDDGPEEEDLSVDEEGQVEVEENDFPLPFEPRKPVELGTLFVCDSTPIVDIVERNELGRRVRPSRGGLE